MKEKVEYLKGIGKPNTYNVVPPHMVKYEECKGCKGCLGDVKPQYIDKHGVTKKCPCLICLIKGMCEKTCEEFYEFNFCYLNMDRMKEGNLLHGRVIK